MNQFSAKFNHQPSPIHDNDNQFGPDRLIHLPMYMGNVSGGGDSPHKQWFNRWKGDIAATTLSVFTAHTIVQFVKDISKNVISPKLGFGQDGHKSNMLASTFIGLLVSLGIIIGSIMWMDRRTKIMNKIDTEYSHASLNPTQHGLLFYNEKRNRHEPKHSVHH